MEIQETILEVQKVQEAILSVQRLKTLILLVFTTKNKGFGVPGRGLGSRMPKVLNVVKRG